MADANQQIGQDEIEEDEGEEIDEEVEPEHDDHIVDHQMDHDDEDDEANMGIEGMEQQIEIEPEDQRMQQDDDEEQGDDDIDDEEEMEIPDGLDGAPQLDDKGNVIDNMPDYGVEGQPEGEEEEEDMLEIDEDQLRQLIV